MKGNVRIGGALAFGILIVLGALYVGKIEGGKQAGSVVVSKAPERTYIEEVDSDNNGVKDWEQGLTDKVFDAIEVPTTTLATSSDNYEPPTTFTAQFSEAFFKDYLQGKMNGQDFSDPSKFIGNAVTAIDANTQSKKHIPTELNIIPDSEDAFHEYGNAFGKIMLSKTVPNENEAAILQKALTANDPAILDRLVPIRDAYDAYVTEALTVPVPTSLAQEHLAALNTIESVRADVAAMQLAFKDPLLALARTRGYEKDATALYSAFAAINKKLSDGGVVYTKDDPGSFFYLFNS